MQLLCDWSWLTWEIIQSIATCVSSFCSRLSESSFKVHVEKVSLEQRKMDRDKQLYLIPLEIKLKHSTVHMDEQCPLLAPNPGVSVIHDYSDWVRKASEDPAVTESECWIILLTVMAINLEICPVQINFKLHQSSQMSIKHKNQPYLSILSESLNVCVCILGGWLPAVTCTMVSYKITLKTLWLFSKYFSGFTPYDWVTLYSQPLWSTGAWRGRCVKQSGGTWRSWTPAWRSPVNTTWPWNAGEPSLAGCQRPLRHE